MDVWCMMQFQNTLALPMLAIIFIINYVGMNKMSGMNWTDSYNDMKKKFWPVYKVHQTFYNTKSVILIISYRPS